MQLFSYVTYCESRSSRCARLSFLSFKKIFFSRSRMTGRDRQNGIFSSAGLFHIWPQQLGLSQVKARCSILVSHMGGPSSVVFPSTLVKSWQRSESNWDSQQALQCEMPRSQPAAQSTALQSVPVPLHQNNLVEPQLEQNCLLYLQDFESVTVDVHEILDIIDVLIFCVLYFL